MHIPKTKAKKLIWKVLSSMPIDVFDDDEGSIWEIGAANLVSAFNLLHQKMLIAELSNDDGFSDCGEEALDLFKDVMDDFEQEKLIRKRPEHVRETFRVIEGSNVASEQ